MFAPKAHFPAAVIAAIIASASACSPATDPVADVEQEQFSDGYRFELTDLPAPGMYVARDREGNVRATGRLLHSPATKRLSWVFARGLGTVRKRTLGDISTYSGPDPDCSANMGDSEEELAEFADCTNQLYADPECAVVVTEYYRESGDLHAHCMEPL